MATHSGILAWRLPGTEEPGGLPSMGSHRVGHNWSDAAASSMLLQQLRVPTLFNHEITIKGMVISKQKKVPFLSIVCGEEATKISDYDKR